MVVRSIWVLGLAPQDTEIALFSFFSLEVKINKQTNTEVLTVKS